MAAPVPQTAPVNVDESPVPPSGVVASSGNEEIEYPESWNCPINLTLMRDPVIGPDGVTYERRAIEDWLQTSNRSPVTREIMPSTSLIPNRALKQTIADALAGTGLLDDAPTSNSTAPNIPPANESLELEAKWGTLPGREGKLLEVGVKPPTSGNRKPATFVCVIDVSYSMGIEASLPTKGDEEAAFSRLDLVKHSMNTIISVLGDKDRLAVVPFSGVASVELPLTAMNTAGRDLAKTKVAGLKPTANTNIWQGLREGMALAAQVTDDSNTVVLLLTDGESNVNPPRGLVPTLRNWLMDPEPKFTIHTFGFGYQLDSAQLSAMATLGNGSFAYIPDCSMVGTVFINFLSNILATACRLVKMTATFEDADVSFLGYESNGEPTTLNLGLVQYGQARTVVLEVKPRSDTAAPGNGIISITSPSIPEPIEIAITPELPTFSQLDFETARLLLVETVSKCLVISDNEPCRSDSSATSQPTALELIKSLTSIFEASSDPGIQSLLQDIKSTSAEDGQIEKALSKEEWYKNWGRHYLRSVISAHRLQNCNNFKDSGVQAYGGNLFRGIQSMTEELFLTLTPPAPSVVKSSFHASDGTVIRSRRRACGNQSIPSMRDYYSASAGCFHGDSRVLLYGGNTKAVSQVCKGDTVTTSEGNPATVKCVVTYPTQSDQVELAQIGKLLITPWHPVRINNQWGFPKSSFPTIFKKCSFVYNLVLENGHTAFLEGIECCTLGHGFTDPIVKHDYFGTAKVLEDLQKLQGWDNGAVEVRCQGLRRHPLTHKIQQMIVQQ